MTYDAELYALLHRGTPGDAEAYARWAEGAASVLELGCGYGRVLQRLADVPSVGRAVGLDDDPSLLSRVPVHEKITTVRADMRDFDLGERFDRIFAPHGSMWCLTEDGDFERCLAAVARHLVPGGRFVFDAWAADELHAESLPEDIDEDHLEMLDPITTSDGTAWEVFERSTWHKEAQRMDVTYLYLREGSDEPVEGLIRQRYRLSKQIPPLLAEAGLRTRGLYGDFEDRPFAYDDDLLIVEAELPIR